MRAFGTSSAVSKWVPTLHSHPHILLSNVAIISSWLDMVSKTPGDSKRTILIKGEIISMINERLDHPDTRLTNSTLVVILHLLGGEIWSCNEKTIRMHETGVAQFISRRGGLQHIATDTPITEFCAA